MHLRIITLNKIGLLVAQSSCQVQPVFPMAVVHNIQVNFSKRHIAALDVSNLNDSNGGFWFR